MIAITIHHVVDMPTWDGGLVLVVFLLALILLALIFGRRS